MDLKSKGIAWVGNIYQRFETMCPEVDSIVNQNTVRYVENQVHTVGESMKKFCDVVQDIIPPIVDPVRCEAQAVAIKGNAVVGTYIKSMIGIEEDHGRMDPIKQSFAEPSDFDVRNQPSNTFSGHHFVNQSTTATPMDSLEVTAFDSDPGNINDILTNDLGTPGPGKIDDISTNKISDLSTEENKVLEKSNIPEALELIAPEEKELLHASIPGEFIDSTHESARVSPEEKKSLHVSLSSEFIHSNDENAFVSMGEVSPATSVHEEDHRSAQKMETACYSLADDSYSVSDSLSVVSVSEMAFSAASSCGSIFTEPCTLHENSFNDVLAVVSCSNRVSVAGHDSHSSNVLSSSISAPVASRDREVAETGSTCSNDVLSLESAGCSNYSSYICDDILDPVMETIDLFDKAKLEESRITVTNSMLYEVSRRTHKLRSYKKRIQDAFTSKKRLSKEYEQLAIWFGDIDLDSSQDTVPGQLEASKTITLDPAMQIDHTCDSEWELL